jgi:hypothetical protein
MALIGKTMIMPGLRETLLTHSYVFRGEDKETLFSDTGKIFVKRHFVSSIEEAGRYAENTNNAEPSTAYLDEEPAESDVSILELFNIDSKTLAQIMAAILDASAKTTKSVVYMLRRHTKSHDVIENFELLQTLFARVPEDRVKNLGFITYFKSVSPNISESLPTLINIRFVEASDPANRIYDDKEAD